MALSRGREEIRFVTDRAASAPSGLFQCSHRVPSYRWEQLLTRKSASILRLFVLSPVFPY